MRGEFCTVADAAERLGVHRKTIRRYIREDRLPARRVGKAYRIRWVDLAEFAGEAVSAAPPRVTCIVDVPAVGDDLAQTWARSVMSALNARPRGAPLRADTVYDPEQRSLKIIIIGPPRDTMNLLGLITIWMDQLGLDTDPTLR